MCPRLRGAAAPGRPDAAGGRKFVSGTLPSYMLRMTTRDRHGITPGAAAWHCGGRGLAAWVRAAPCGPGGWAFFLDLDGTLLDLAATPEAVSVAAGLTETLAGLERLTDGALAVVTGRTVDFVDGLFPGRPLTVAGLHGAELRPAPALAGMVPASAAPRPGPGFRAARDGAREAARHLPGVLFEDKARAFALHYRQAPGQREAVARIMAVAQGRAGPEYRLRAGKCVLELGSAGADKGAAVRALMAQRPFRGRYPVAAGDDLTDETMFRAVNELGGLSLRVGPPEALAGSAAMAGAASPAELRAWLGGLRP